MLIQVMSGLAHSLQEKLFDKKLSSIQLKTKHSVKIMSKIQKRYG